MNIKPFAYLTEQRSCSSLRLKQTSQKNLSALCSPQRLCVEQVAYKEQQRIASSKKEASFNHKVWEFSAE